MPIVEIEIAPDQWERRDMSFEERRRLLTACKPEQRFIKDDIVYIAHPSNLWCLVSGDPPFRRVD